MARRRRTFRDVAIYYRDENKVWRKIENVIVGIENGIPQNIYFNDFERSRNRKCNQLYLTDPNKM